MQSSEKQSLRVLLTQRQGRGFSEADVREILRQVLPQLAQLHSEGKSHGTISLDTLVQRDGKIAIALPPTTQPVSKARILKDIYDLGAAVIELLAAKAPNLLRNSDGSWNWEDDCAVTDQLVEVINRMVADLPQNRFNSTNEILSALGFTDKTSVVVPPISERVSLLFNTKLSDLRLNGISKKNVEIKKFHWNMITLAALGLFVTVTNPSKNDYLAYEHKRFKENFPGYASEKMCNYYQTYYNRYRMRMNDYYEMCSQALTEVLKQQDDNYILSSLSESTQVKNFIIFSIYETKYGKLFGSIQSQIDKNLEIKITDFLSRQKPEYFLKEEPSIGTSSTEYLSANYTIGMLGNLLDNRDEKQFEN